MRAHFIAAAALAATSCSFLVSFPGDEGRPCDPSGACPAGFRCANNVCVVGATPDSGPTDSGTPTDGGCGSGCGTNQVCIAQMCVDCGAPAEPCCASQSCWVPGATCNASLDSCGCGAGMGNMCGSGASLICTNTDTDLNNCGTCGHACGPDGGDLIGCCSGACRDLIDDAANCGVCGNICAASSVCCSGNCSNNATDPLNCGMCGFACGLAQGCAGSACTGPRCGAWSLRAPMPAADVGQAAAPVTVGGAPGVLFASGFATPNDMTVSFYDPATDAWTSLAPTLQQHENGAAAPVKIGADAGVLLLGGNPTPSATAEFYDPATNTWTQVQSMITARNFLRAAPVTMGGVAGVLAVGGDTNAASAVSTAEFYNPQTNSWSAVSPMNAGRSAAVAAPVTIGGVLGVLVVGGYDVNFALLSSAEFFNPTTNAWSTEASMSLARWGAAGGSTSDGGSTTGMVVVGGYQTNVAPFLASSSAELYDPVTNAWSSASSLSIARAQLAGAPATLERAKGVVVAGGKLQDAGVSSGAEFYCP